jgi:hypothetical protein
MIPDLKIGKDPPGGIGLDFFGEPNLLEGSLQTEDLPGFREKILHICRG